MLLLCIVLLLCIALTHAPSHSSNPPQRPQNTLQCPNVPLPCPTTRPTNYVSFSCEQILMGAIKEQCEYYFGPRHRMNVKGFQHFETLMDEEGYVPVPALFTFKRLAALTSDPDMVANALRESRSVEVAMRAGELAGFTLALRAKVA